MFKRFFRNSETSETLPDTAKFDVEWDALLNDPALNYAAAESAMDESIQAQLPDDYSLLLDLVNSESYAGLELAQEQAAKLLREKISAIQKDFRVSSDFLSAYIFLLKRKTELNIAAQIEEKSTLGFESSVPDLREISNSLMLQLINKNAFLTDRALHRLLDVAERYKKEQLIIVARGFSDQETSASKLKSYINELERRGTLVESEVSYIFKAFQSYNYERARMHLGEYIEGNVSGLKILDEIRKLESTKAIHLDYANSLCVELQNILEQEAYESVASVLHELDIYFPSEVSKIAETVIGDYVMKHGLERDRAEYIKELLLANLASK